MFFYFTYPSAHLSLQGRQILFSLAKNISGHWFRHVVELSWPLMVTCLHNVQFPGPCVPRFTERMTNLWYKQTIAKAKHLLDFIQSFHDAFFLLSKKWSCNIIIEKYKSLYYHAAWKSTGFFFTNKCRVFRDLRWKYMIWRS